MCETDPDPLDVLLVDPDDRLTPVERSLRSEDPTIRVRTVGSPEAIGRTAADGVPDCIVTLDAPGTDDYPPVNGIDQLDRAMRHADDVPVVLYSVDDAGDLVWRAIGRGAADIVCVDAERATLLTRRIRHAAGRGESFQTDSELLDSLLDHLPHQIFIKDDEGRIADASAVTAVEYGFTRDQIVGLTDYELLAPDTADANYREEREIMATGEPVVNKIERFTDDSGRDHWLSVTKAARYDDRGEAVGIIGTTREVTEEKRQEQLMNALHEASRDLVAAETKDEISAITVEIAADISALPLTEMALYDPEADELRAAPADRAGNVAVFETYREFYEQAFQSGEPQYITDLRVEPDEDEETDEEMPEANKLEAIDADEALAEVEQVLADDGRLETSLVSEVATADDESDDDSGPMGLVLPLDDHGALGIAATTGRFDEFTVDLAKTLAAHVEASLDRAEREELLREREAELERQNERLEEFASIISHDLRNPLNVAQAYLGAMRDSGDMSHADAVEESLDRMERLTEELLTLARKGQVVGETEPVSLVRVARDAWATVDTGGATLVVGDDTRLEADADRLAELFENLFRNAVEHGSTSPDSQARRDPIEHGSTGHDAVTVRVGATAEGFFVADDGPGIPAEDREEVLEMGYTTDEDGTGFGLYIVAAIAQAHGWDVTVEESADGGARFVLGGVE